ncbi:MAG TPA: lysylphosphatidylglycerol synthase transmembrane domain-containing protein [Bacteroidales bacterium]|nr:lysylphosphatidylglycerol synthase transmembrane domain-containing protein [Bacteroidales bacterium]
MTEQNDKALKQIRPGRIILPMLIGLAVVVYFIIRDYKPGMFSALQFTAGVGIMLFFAFCMMVVRDFGYIVRIRVLSDGKLTWRQGFNVIMLWEFASSVTPSAVGGTTIATYFLWKEGFSAGKSAAIVMATSFLDELYFTLMFPVLFLIFSKTGLFTLADGFNSSFFYFAVIGYGVKLFWVLLMAFALFIRPQIVKKLIEFVFRFRLLKKWRQAANQAGQDIVLASAELKTKQFTFWINAFLATFFSWTARYWVLNFLILALAFGIPGLDAGSLFSAGDHFLIFAKQLVMWIMMLVMPTPGGSGFVEAVFTTYMADFMPVVGFVSMMALLWRFVTYYPYLLLGAVIAPRWVARSRKAKV